MRVLLSADIGILLPQLVLLAQVMKPQPVPDDQRDRGQQDGPQLGAGHRVTSYTALT